MCDCGLQWLSVWLLSHRYTDARARCGYPHWLHGMPLTHHHANFTCDEFPKPRIIEEPASQMSIRGDNVSLACRATSTADTPLQFTWKHENVELRDADLQTDTGSSERGITEASSILHLVNVTHADAGRYQCMVANTYGTTYSAKAKISVLGESRLSRLHRTSAGLEKFIIPMIYIYLHRCISKNMSAEIQETEFYHKFHQLCFASK